MSEQPSTDQRFCQVKKHGMYHSGATCGDPAEAVVNGKALCAVHVRQGLATRCYCYAIEGDNKYCPTHGGAL